MCVEFVRANIFRALDVVGWEIEVSTRCTHPTRETLRILKAASNAFFIKFKQLQSSSDRLPLGKISRTEAGILNIMRCPSQKGTHIFIAHHASCSTTIGQPYHVPDIIPAGLKASETSSIQYVRVMICVAQNNPTTKRSPVTFHGHHTAFQYPL